MIENRKGIEKGVNGEVEVQEKAKVVKKVREEGKKGDMKQLGIDRKQIEEVIEKMKNGK